MQGSEMKSAAAELECAKQTDTIRGSRSASIVGVTVNIGVSGPTFSGKE
jgi:hypothetical protein